MQAGKVEDLQQLRRDCELAAKLWGRTFSALSAITYREKGEGAVAELWVKLLRHHQDGFYRQGLRKLGISDAEPPAIAAAKYHYLTNIMGGLAMEYVEESPKKVWIRYLAPMWTYAGVAMMAMPGGLRRRIFTGWHPRNGEFMGCRRLGWVSTKFIMEGDPCDEGYFIEHDHDLPPGQEFRYEIPRSTPEFDPNKAPTLDAASWPEARMLKARRNWSREYARSTTECLFQLAGEQSGYFILRQVMRCLAIQYCHELKKDLAIAGNDAAAVSTFFARILAACGQDYELEQINDTKYVIVLKSFLPFAADASEHLRAACFEFQVMAARLFNGRLSVSRRLVANRGAPTSELWEIEDAGRWLW